MTLLNELNIGLYDSEAIDEELYQHLSAESPIGKLTNSSRPVYMGSQKKLGDERNHFM